VAHACNLSYSGSRDQEDHRSKSVRANSLRDLISKKTLHKKRASREAKIAAPDFTSQHWKKKCHAFFKMSITLIRLISYFSLSFRLTFSISKNNPYTLCVGIF
jgi:hypothetical protein